VTADVAGPTWSGTESGTYPGRFPLSVERHVMGMADRLVPGVTTVTLNARYYCLHGLVAAEAKSRGLDESAAKDLMRRAEVVVGAVSARHWEAGGHGGLSRPHGYDMIAPQVRAGNVDITALSSPGRYANSEWGFWPPYRGSEAVLQITTESGIAPGEQFDATAVTAGLGDVLSLTGRSVLTTDVLDDHEHLCVCQSVASSDGDWLARLLAQPGISDERPTRAWTRRQTLRTVARCVQLTTVDRASIDIAEFLAYNKAVTQDTVLTSTPVAAQWRGVILRNYSVGAWRDLWRWLVEGINGLTERARLGDLFAAGLPDQTVRAFSAQLPATRTADKQPAPAELDHELAETDWPQWCLSILLLGARRARELAGNELAGFQGRAADDINEELAPAWLASQVDDWRDQSVRDFARWLTELMINRSQRLALRKATPDRKTGVLKIPSRVYLRDGFLFRDSSEGGGQASLRLDQLAGILAGVGLLTRDAQGHWAVGPRGDLLA
jgi:hypothetical protein